MKKKMTVLTGLLMAVAITAYSVSGTYAKYTSTFTGSSSATVAKWAFSVNGQTDATDEFEFDLFDTINDTLRDEDGNILAETDVKEGLIAPGTMGKFNLAIVNNSEVSANVTISGTLETKNQALYNKTVEGTNEGETTVLEDQVANIPLEFSLDGNGNWKSLDDVLAEISKDLLYNPNGSSVTQDIYWRWAFNTGDDERDTALGLAANTENVPQVVVKLNVTATQID